MAFDFVENTSGFRILYDSVSVRLRRRLRDFEPPFAFWLEELIAGFQKEYEGWGHAQSPVTAYLESVEGKAAGRKWLKLIGHAYLHISYDLPRVIARTLRKQPKLDPHSARYVYEDLRDTFSQSWVDLAGNAQVVGSIALIGRLVPRDYLEASIHYVLSLRYQAWSNAEVIRRSATAKEVKRLEAELLDWVEFYLDQVPRSWNPVRWIAKLQAPLLRDREDFLIGSTRLRETSEKPGLKGRY